MKLLISVLIRTLIIGVLYHLIAMASGAYYAWQSMIIIAVVAFAVMYVYEKYIIRK